MIKIKIFTTCTMMMLLFSFMEPVNSQRMDKFLQIVGNLAAKPVVRYCRPVKMRKVIERQGCKPLTVLDTTKCVGRCLSYEEPHIEAPYVKSSHQLCQLTARDVPLKQQYQMKCDQGVNPYYTHEDSFECRCSQPRSLRTSYRYRDAELS
ncbi:gonadotropin subunit beta-2-like [Anneissia japonica]|uniref:gonadotropin subunit beta-2-like n=1 Tax=Anneissia japonica TaxID=1529436 RepID=UPI0014255180|nr:gonadotropin subunit beta-2-like [Anneissia japonica]